MKMKIFAIFLVFGFLFFGCVNDQNNQKYFCDDGQEVNNLSECTKLNLTNESKKCSDGTELFSCSDSKPNYCNENFELEERASKCGCLEGYTACLEKCIGEDEICCIDDLCAQKFLEVLNSKIDYNTNVEIDIIEMEKISDGKKKLAEIYALFLIKNNGQDKATIYCSDFTVEDISKREYVLRESKLEHFGKKTQNSYSIEANGSALIECYQKIDYEAELEYIQIKENEQTIKKYTLFPETWAKFQNLEYVYMPIGESKEQTAYVGTKGPLKVTLEKIGKKTYKNKMQIIVFWKLENLKRPGWYEYLDRIFIFPYKNTAIGINGTRYYSEYIAGQENFELAEGYISPLGNATGSVVIPNLPNHSGPTKVYLEVKDFVDFWFEINLE